MIEKNREPLQISNIDYELISLDGGRTPIKFIDHLNKTIESQKIDVSQQNKIALDNIHLYFSKLWVKANVLIHLELKEKYFLKYLIPKEYSHPRNHITKEILPYHFKIDIPIDVDESFVEIDHANIPISSSLSVEIEENLNPITNLSFGDFSLYSISV